MKNIARTPLYQRFAIPNFSYNSCFMRIIFAFLLLILMPVTARAADVARPPEVIRAEKYLQSITTMQAHFVQTANDGRQVGGTFYLKRPGKLRFEYDPPVRDFVVADGVFIYYYDGQLDQQSNAPIGQTLADFLLRREIKLHGDVTVTGIERGNGLLQITAVQTADPSSGTLTLGFTDNPMELKKWRVVDGTGAITEVALTEARTGIDLPSELFVYKAPPRAQGRYNQ
jgi:outer membrane lipoprotein-sorting protein